MGTYIGTNIEAYSQFTYEDENRTERISASRALDAIGYYLDKCKQYPGIWFFTVTRYNHETPEFQTEWSIAFYDNQTEACERISFPAI